MSDSSDLNARTRAILATVIIVASISGIVALSLVAIFALSGPERTNMTELAFSSVLPLLGTWVGTVLAFYFARESLQAATDSTSQLVRHTDPQSPVVRVMIPPNLIVSHAVKHGESPDAVELAGLMNEMTRASKHRIPVLYTTGSVAYVLHESTITKYAAVISTSASTPSVDPLATKTISDMLAIPDLADLIKAMGFVPVTATIADARNEMRRVPNCNDIFVTAGGRPDEPVLGWLTNTDLASKS